jgi:hypothetical protein
VIRAYCDESYKGTQVYAIGGVVARDRRFRIGGWPTLSPQVFDFDSEGAALFAFLFLQRVRAFDFQPLALLTNIFCTPSASRLNIGGMIVG